MKILIVSQYFWPENFRINDLTQELLRRGHSVTVLTGIPNYPTGTVFEEYLKTPKAFDNYSGARVVRVPMLTRGNSTVRLFFNYLSFVTGACLFGLWRLRGQQTDAIFVFGPSPVTVGLPAILLGRIKRAPVLFWVLDLWPDTLAAMGVVRSSMILWCVGRLVRFIYGRCTLVLGQSRSFLSKIAKYCSDSHKIRYFSNWAEEIFSQTGLAPAPEIQLMKDRFNILFAGNIGEAQDLSAVLEAAEILRCNSDIRWFFVGDGRCSGWLREEVARRGLNGNVVLLGQFPLERMPSFYACANALLVSLKKDPVFSLTIPGKVQSYLMAGVPILGMLDGEGAQIITDSKAGIVCAAGNSEGLASAILQMLAMNPEELMQLGVNGRRYAQKEFGRAYLMNQLEALLHEAIDLHRQARINA